MYESVNVINGTETKTAIETWLKVHRVIMINLLSHPTFIEDKIVSFPHEPSYKQTKYFCLQKA